MSHRATTIAVVNQKGGTDKTTTTENLGIGLAQEGKKVLLIDTDPQASLTISLGYPRPDDIGVTLSDIMNKIIDDKPIQDREGILTHAEGVDLMPSNIALSGMEVSLVNAMSRESILKQYIDTVNQKYDYILLDCITVNRNVLMYIHNIINLTRSESRFRLGASPRAMLALTRASQARAFLCRRDYVMPDDVRYVVNDVLLHRLILTSEAKMRGEDPEGILHALVLKAKIPV